MAKKSGKDSTAKMQRPKAAEKEYSLGGASVPVSRSPDAKIAREDTRPTKLEPSALLDTRVIYSGDNLEQSSNLPALRVNLVNSFLNGRRPLLHALDYPIWNYITQTFDYTRSYEQGLAFSTRLLAELEKNRKVVPPKKLAEYLFRVFYFVFRNLDKLDRWDDYLALWNKLESIRSVSVSNMDGAQSFHSIIFRDNTFRAFELLLKYLDYRKAVIVRKLEKKQRGAKLGNLFHEKQTDLTSEEIRERFEWIINFRLTGVYDFNPPASKQRRTRRKQRTKENPDEQIARKLV